MICVRPSVFSLTDFTSFTTQITGATATVMPRIASAARTLLRPSERTGSIVNKRRITRRRATSAYIPALLDVKRARIHLPLRSLGQNPHVRLAVCLVALLAGAARAQPGARVPVTLEAALAAEGKDTAEEIGRYDLAAAEANIEAATAWPAPGLHVGTNRLTA